MNSRTCATAGNISSTLRMLVTCSIMSKRFSPASASKVASQTPSLSLRNLLCTFPLKFSTCINSNQDFTLCRSDNKSQLQSTTGYILCTGKDRLSSSLAKAVDPTAIDCNLWMIILWTAKSMLYAFPGSQLDKGLAKYKDFIPLNGDT